MMSPELQAANAILKRGVSYKIPAPLFLRLLGREQIKITITQLCMGTELRVAALLAERGITDKKIADTEPSEFMIEHYTDILKVVALTSLNRLAVSRVAMWLRINALKRLSVWQLFELYAQIKQYSGLTPFMTITRLAVETRTTKPNLGQETTGV